MSKGVSCHTCNEQIKKTRGCYGLDESTEIEGVEIDKCPVKYPTRQSHYFIQAFMYVEKGIMMHGGGLGDQPAKLIEAIEFVSNLLEKNRGE